MIWSQKEKNIRYYIEIEMNGKEQNWTINHNKMPYWISSDTIHILSLLSNKRNLYLNQKSATTMLMFSA